MHTQSAGASTFPKLWRKIEPILSSGVFVAHNAPFDMGVLKKCLIDYNIQWTVPYCCTVQIVRCILPGMSHKPNSLCDYYGICFDHHKADSDSGAAARILIQYMEIGAVLSDNVKEYVL